MVFLTNLSICRWPVLHSWQDMTLRDLMLSQRKCQYLSPSATLRHVDW